MADDTLQKKLGKAIRSNRVAREISQDAFADEIGMHRAYYSSIERGERNLTVNTLHRVAEGLGIKLSQLLREAGN